MSRTNPTPLSALRASMFADRIALTASSTAVWKPKVLSRSKISLSIVFGTPITLVVKPFSRQSLSMANAPACEPFPPMTNKKSIPMSSIFCTMAGISAPPRLDPSMLPPVI